MYRLPLCLYGDTVHTGPIIGAGQSGKERAMKMVADLRTGAVELYDLGDGKTEKCQFCDWEMSVLD